MASLWKNANDVIDFAIGEEEKAVAMYNEMAANATSSEVRKLLHSFSAQETEHKLKLIALRQDSPLSLTVEQLALLEEDCTPDPAVAATMDRQDAFRFAIFSECQAESLYSMLAEMTQDPETAALFRGLALDEKGHRDHFEKLSRE